MIGVQIIKLNMMIFRLSFVDSISPSRNLIHIGNPIYSYTRGIDDSTRDSVYQPLKM